MGRPPRRPKSPRPLRLVAPEHLSGKPALILTVLVKDLTGNYRSFNPRGFSYE